MSAIAQPDIRHSANEARLAEYAALLETWLARRGRIPILWATERFARSVELVRTHLQPIAGTESLGLSYGREHFHTFAVEPPSPPSLMSRDSTEVAYAIRWLELTSGSPRASWTALITSGRSA